VVTSAVVSTVAEVSTVDVGEVATVEVVSTVADDVGVCPVVETDEVDVDVEVAVAVVDAGPDVEVTTVVLLVAVLVVVEPVMSVKHCKKLHILPGGVSSRAIILPSTNISPHPPPP
jgi:hypothetical protein